MGEAPPRGVPVFVSIADRGEGEPPCAGEWLRELLDSEIAMRWIPACGAIGVLAKAV